MNFLSTGFLIFIVIVFVIYFTFPAKNRWIILLIASYVFYFFAGWRLVLFLLITTITTFFLGLIIGKEITESSRTNMLDFSSIDNKEKNIHKQKVKNKNSLLLLIAISINFGILALLKYSGFLSDSLNELLNFFSIDSSLPSFNFLLPLGISFYTFQSIGYVIDVYRGQIQPETNIAKYSLFVSFFPQIIQGPISRYNILANQLYVPHEFDFTRIKFGAQLIIWGLFKKLVIADRASVIVNTVFNNDKEYSGFVLLIAAMLYCIQIYCDFSGGIDIASGVAEGLGIYLPKNFNRPLFARSVTDFWQRWHITLSSWMRDYVFYPLSLSKPLVRLGRLSRKVIGNDIGKLIPSIMAMFVTFLLIGLWHGAQWKFIAYGLYNGVFIIFELLISKFIFRHYPLLKSNQKQFSWVFFQVLATFFIISIGRFFSRAEGFSIAVRMIINTFAEFNPWIFFDQTLFKLGLDESNFILLIVCILILIIVDFLQEIGFKLRESISRQNIIFRWGIYYLAIFSIIIFGMYGFEYLASSFIYRGF